MGRNCSRCRAKIARGRGTRESWEWSKTERGVRDGKATDATESNVGQNTQAFHGLRNPPFWVHFQGKTANAPCGTRAPTDFPGLTTLPPRTAGPSGRSPLPRAPNAPPSSQRRRPACNGLVPPPPPKPGALDARRRGESNLRTPTLPPHPRAVGCLRVLPPNGSPPPPGEAGCAATALLTWRPPLRRLTYAAPTETARGAGASGNGAPPAPDRHGRGGSPARRTRTAPATHPDSYPLHAYLRGREREKERYLSASGTRRLPQSPAATALAGGGDGTRAHSRESARSHPRPRSSSARASPSPCAGRVPDTRGGVVLCSGCLPAPLKAGKAARARPQVRTPP